MDETLGFIVALALHDFSFSSLFTLPLSSPSSSTSSSYEAIDRRLQDLAPRLGTIKHTGAIRVLFTSIPQMPKDTGVEGQSGLSLRRYFVYKVLERLSAHNHRNYAIMNSLHLVGPLFTAYHSGSGVTTTTAGDEVQPQTPLPKPERQVVLKLLKRLLELGSTSQEARLMFQCALMRDNENEETLNVDVLEVLRAGMKTRWPEHFSLEGPAALVVPCEPSKGLPGTGFTFMVSPHVPHSHRNSTNLVCFLCVRRHGSGSKPSPPAAHTPFSRFALQIAWCSRCGYAQMARWSV